ncbi:unnamed protein product [Rotaria sordida]|uniref:Uncharacterized protein n=1 Tax=Rotaria sordida TaxID=392033 RepID=A0A814CQ69_9BILA|nr:unnamed protein product [Rotaria sordida]
MGCNSSAIITLERLPPASTFRDNRRTPQSNPARYQNQKRMPSKNKFQPRLNASLSKDDLNDIHEAPCDECGSQYIIGDRYRYHFQLTEALPH